MMPPSLLPKAVDFIRSHENRDGGWGYEAGRASLVEPTGWCVMALHSNGDRPAALRGLDFLKSCVKSTGAVGVDPGDPEGSWMAYAALLAFHALGAADEERRLEDWILSYEDASGRFTEEDRKAIAAVYRYDSSIPGWSWTPRTTAWVEPTSLFIVALIQAGVPTSDKRVRSGVALILDRRIPSGGWNFGNAHIQSHDLGASAMSTALALAALGRAGVPESHPAVAAGIRYLARDLSDDTSAATLAWSLFALRAYASGQARLATLATRLAGRQSADGSFRQNLFETALACLVLGDAPILKKDAGRNR